MSIHKVLEYLLYIFQLVERKLIVNLNSAPPIAIFNLRKILIPAILIHGGHVGELQVLGVQFGPVKVVEPGVVYDLQGVSFEAKPVPGVLLQETLNKVFTLIGYRDILFENNVFENNLLVQLFYFDVVKRWLAAEKLVGQDSQGPPVNSEVVAFTHQNFRRYVLGGAAKGGGLLVILQDSGEPEVYYLDVPLAVDHAVLQFQISVDVIVLVQPLNSLHDACYINFDHVLAKFVYFH